MPESIGNVVTHIVLVISDKPLNHSIQRVIKMYGARLVRSEEVRKIDTFHYKRIIFWGDMEKNPNYFEVLRDLKEKNLKKRVYSFSLIGFAETPQGSATMWQNGMNFVIQSELQILRYLKP